MTLSKSSIIQRLKTHAGRDFTLAVRDAFEYLGFEVEDIELTQGTQAHSDLIVKAHLATNPYFAVVECTAVREGSQIGYTKLYQLGSNFPRYITKYSKKYPSASYKMLVGRPEFSSDAKKLAEDTTLMSVKTLIKLLKVHGEYHLSQDELEQIYQCLGELTEKKVHGLSAHYSAKATLYAWIYMSLLENPTDKSVKRKKEWTNVERLIAIVKHWGWFFHDIEVGETKIKKAINELSSDVVRALLIDRDKIMLSSLPFENIVRNMGNLGRSFKTQLTRYMDKVAKLKQS